MTVKDLNQDQLETLKCTIFSDFLSADLFLIEKLEKRLTKEEIETIEQARDQFDISNEIVYKLYADVYFVEEDFYSNKGEEKWQYMNYL